MKPGRRLVNGMVENIHGPQNLFSQIYVNKICRGEKENLLGAY